MEEEFDAKENVELSEKLLASLTPKEALVAVQLMNMSYRYGYKRGADDAARIMA